MEKSDHEDNKSHHEGTSDHEDNKSQEESESIKSKVRGPSITVKPTRSRPIVKYNKRGVGVGTVARKLATFEGIVARTMCPITYASWFDVDEDTKEDMWQCINQHYVVHPNTRKQTLQSIGNKWKQFKYTLYDQYIKPLKDDPEAKKELLKPPEKYPFLQEKDWKFFVSTRTTKAWQVS
jgi:Mg2+ and Co2+ transporter CorA